MGRQPRNVLVVSSTLPIAVHPMRISEDLVMTMIIGGLLLILLAFVAFPPTTALSIVAVAGATVGLLRYLHVSAARRRAALETREWQQKRAKGLASASAAAAGRLAERYRDANGWLDAAEAEFAEGAFAPFWDAVENAVRHLGEADAEMKKIAESMGQYRQLLGLLDQEPPALVLGVLPSGTPTSDRLRSLVRRGQKSFRFATIYEQRRTNQILIAGFTSLGEALDRIGDRLAEGQGILALG